jgi:competence protein ComEC
MNVAERVIKPQKPGIFRTIFLYTGQGESTLLVIPSGPGVNDYQYVLLDSDLDYEPNEVNLVAMFKDLFVNSGELLAFINTHPHNDHIGGIKEVYNEIGFQEVWHSNHKPGGKHKDKYEDFHYVVKQVGKAKEYHLKGSNELNKLRTVDDVEVIYKLGDVDFQVLSPAEYLCEEIDEGGADERNKRIHEQCGVIKFTYGNPAKNIMFTGDSDKTAWKDHITDYHFNNLPSEVLSASHHGSRTFFKSDKDDTDPYEDHIEQISPVYLIISAPRREDSPHEHPHKDAMELYEKHIDEDGIFHLGAEPCCVIVDIDAGGNLSVETDTSLIAEYGGAGDDDGDDEEQEDKYKSVNIIPSTTRIDDKPMAV